MLFRSNSALRYRAQAPLVDGLLKELGLSGGDINGLTQNLNPAAPANQTQPQEEGEAE